MASAPVVNITMPVFNRADLTQKAILSLRENAGAIPFTLTVVDNGSEKNLGELLVAFHKQGFIDKLFLLPRNMGISCACNIGWEMTDAPYYMKLDNDMALHDPRWLEILFGLWEYGQPLSNLGPAFSETMLTANAGYRVTPHGILGVCGVSLPGGAILIPKGVSDLLGMWNEEYSLYGAEDGDYGLRMNHAGLPQYYYLLDAVFTNMDPHASAEYRYEYECNGLDKVKEYNSIVRSAEGGLGVYVLNYYLYAMKIRGLKPPRRYAVVDVDSGCRVTLAERKEYSLFHKALMYCKREVDALLARGDANAMFRPEFAERLRTVMRNCGQEYSPVTPAATPR